jgi:hypothetical protein
MARAKRVREYRPWRGWKGAPKGTITDDTQMTMWLAEAILAAARGRADAAASALRDRLIDPADIAEPFTREQMRGIGQATQDFVHAYKELGRWEKSNHVPCQTPQPAVSQRQKGSDAHGFPSRPASPGGYAHPPPGCHGDLGSQRSKPPLGGRGSRAILHPDT